VCSGLRGGWGAIRLVTDTVGMPSASYLVGHSRAYQLYGPGETKLTRPIAISEGDNGKACHKDKNVAVSKSRDMISNSVVC
jgi:hypothetical protein